MTLGNEGEGACRLTDGQVIQKAALPLAGLLFLIRSQSARSNADRNARGVTQAAP